MAVQTPQSIADLVATTLYQTGDKVFGDVTGDRNRFEVLSKWVKKGGETIEGGLGIERRVITGSAGAARHVGEQEPDVVNIADILSKITAHWVHATHNWAYYYGETLHNRGKALILKIVQPREYDCMKAIAEEMEVKAMGEAPTVAQLDLLPMNMKYWISKAATGTVTEGFNGLTSADHTLVGGLNPGNIPGWRNWTAVYAALSKADLVAKWKKMFRHIRWYPPVTAEGLRTSPGRQYRWYVPEVILEAAETLAEGQNDNLGADLAPVGVSSEFEKYEMDVMFRRCPIKWVKDLDADVHVPIYAIDHDTWHVLVLAGNKLRKTGPTHLPHIQHDVWGIFYDLQYQYLCDSRRSNGVIHLAT